MPHWSTPLLGHISDNQHANLTASSDFMHYCLLYHYQQDMLHLIDLHTPHTSDIVGKEATAHFH